MPRLVPFKAVHYVADGDVSSKIAPPYDVLDAGPKAALLERDACNIVAVDLPVTPPKTVGTDEAYETAGELYRQWLAKGVLVRDAEAGVAVYEQVYEVDGQAMRRRGLFCALGVEPFNRKRGGIFRHEKTIAGGIGDRTKLMTATRAQTSPIFGVYSDKQQQVGPILEAICTQREPDLHGVTDADGVEHRCWWVGDTSTLVELEGFFVGTDVFIADGHHRYTTAQTFSKDHPELPGASACLFVLVAAEDPGMIVLPTHRVVCGLKGYLFDDLLSLLEADDRFVLRDDADGARFGLYDGVSGRTVGLDTVGDVLAETFPKRPEVWRTLDVAVLHELLIQRVLRPAYGDDSAEGGVTFKYTADLQEMQRLAAAAPGRLGVVMRATPLKSVMDVAQADEIMPPKSTYFYPKLATGLVIRPLD